jgi:hypothetical protein
LRPKQLRQLGGIRRNPPRLFRFDPNQIPLGRTVLQSMRGVVKAEGSVLLKGSVPMPTNVPGPNAQKASSPYRFAKAINNPNVLLSMIIFLIIAVVMLLFPNLGAIVAECNQF